MAKGYKRATIREMFHEIGNWHNKITVCAGITKELTKKCLRENPKKDLRDKLSAISKNLSRLIKNTKKADRKFRKIHDRVYEIIDPDTGKPR